LKKPAAARCFLSKMAARHGRKISGFKPDTVAYLQAYSWSGNVRELENVVERMVILAEQTLEYLPPDLLPQEIRPRVLDEVRARRASHNVKSVKENEVEETALAEAPLREAASQGETSTATQEPLLLAIEAAEAGEDRHALIALTEQIDWRRRRPEELIRAIQASLFLDMVLLARELADEGRRVFPNDKRLKQWAIVLAPAKIIGTQPASAIGLEASHRWFQQNNASQYKGQWIAVFNGELLGAAPTLKELYDKIGRDQKTPGTIVVQVLS
jgi:hypothetical protein